LGITERDKGAETVVQWELQGERYGLAAAEVLAWLAQVVNNEQVTNYHGHRRRAELVGFRRHARDGR
jgi:hypothetical protein